MMRAHIVWTPVWPGPCRTWAAKFISQNKWRCDGIHGSDDLLQDAYLTFNRIAERYPRVVERAHFMAQFKTAMHNEMHDRARYTQRKRAIHDSTPADASDLNDQRIGETTNAGYLRALIEEAPEELQLALTLIEQNPTLLRSPPHRRRQPRNNLNMKLRHLLGFDKMRLDVHRTYDFVGALKALLT
jgi:hypothetical protein